MTGRSRELLIALVRQRISHAQDDAYRARHSGQPLTAVGGNGETLEEYIKSAERDQVEHLKALNELEEL